MPKNKFSLDGTTIRFSCKSGKNKYQSRNITIQIHVFKMCTINIALTILFQKYFPTRTKRNNLDEKIIIKIANSKINVIRKTKTYKRS